MRIARGMATSAVFACLGVGLAGPASADDFDGTYTMTLGDSPATWTVTPCDPEPGPQPFIPCVRVAETGGKFAPWQGEAHASVGYWTMAVERPDAISCDDGSTLPAKVNYWWNSATLTGSMGFYFPGGCGGAPASSLYAPFTLTKTGGAVPAEG